MVGIGVLGAGARAAGRPRRGGSGTATVTLDWWVGADDGWHVPADDTTTRFRRPGVAPSFETAVRVPSGDFVQRVYGVATPSGSGAIAVDFENASPRAVLDRDVPPDRSAGPGAARRVRRPSGRHTVLPWRARRGSGPPGPTYARRCEPGRWSHRKRRRGTRRSRSRCSCPRRTRPCCAPRWARRSSTSARSPIPTPSSAAGCASWNAPTPRRATGPVGRGRRRRARRPVAARRGTGRGRRARRLGIRRRSDRGWSRLGWRARRAARRRAPVATWNDVRALDAQRAPAEFLLALRQVLAAETGDHVDLLPDFPPEWLGQAVAVHDLPLRAGPLSFAVRWHGARPALLWDAPAGIELRASALDPQWRGRDRAARCCSPSRRPRCSRWDPGGVEGTTIDDPGSFG